MNTTVGEMMTRDVKSLRVEQTLLEAMQFLRENHVRHIPILDGDRLVGVLTDRDIKRATPSALDPSQREVWERIVKETTLAKVMTRDPSTLGPEASMRDVLSAFVEDRIGCMLVVEEGKLVGIVTASDMFRTMLASLDA